MGEGERERFYAYIAECKWLTGVSIEIKEGSIWSRRFLLIKLNPYPISCHRLNCVSVTSPSPLIWLQITLR